MSKNTSKFCLLPIELITLILEELPCADLLQCERVSKQMRKILRETAGLQYKIELAVNGLDDIPSNVLSKAAKRDVLARHTRATQQWPAELVTKQTIPLLEGPLWELCGGVLAQSDGRRDLDFWQLPSKIRGIPGREWGVDVDFDIADFTLDDSQDLLVALEVSSPKCMAHLLTLNTGQVHRDAGVHHLTFPLPPYDFQRPSFHLRICGDYVGVIIRAYDPISEEAHTVFGVANWKTGESKLLTSHWGVLSFAFLDTQHLVILRGLAYPENTTQEGSSTPIVLTIIDYVTPVLPNEVDEEPNCPLVTLNLPAIAVRWEVWHAEVVCDPAPGIISPKKRPSSEPAGYDKSTNGAPAASTQDTQHRSVVPPFHITKDDRIVVIRMNGVDTLFEQGDSVDIFVHASSLVSLFQAHLNAAVPSTPQLPSRSLPSSPVTSPTATSSSLAHPRSRSRRPQDIRLVIPTLNESSYDEDRVRWDVWGVGLTRVLPASVPACVWCYPAYGMKFVGQTDGYVTIYDFNPVAVRRSLSDARQAAEANGAYDADDGYWDGRERRVGDSEEVGTVTSIDRHSRPFFSDVVKSSLPYRKFKTDLKMDAGQFVMINEDSVLLVKENAKQFHVSSL